MAFNYIKLPRPSDMEFEEKNNTLYCISCGYVKDHQISYGNTHITCICYLLDVRSVCCIEGLKNLLALLPSMSQYIPIPDKFNHQYLSALTTKKDHIILSLTDSIHIYNQCFEIIHNAIKENINRFINKPILYQ